jgi:hypothetical protein
LDPKNCNGVAWNNEHAMVVAKVTARPRVNFVKSPYDDDFKAAGCPPCHGGLPEDFLPRDRRSRPRRRKARQIHYQFSAAHCIGLLHRKWARSSEDSYGVNTCLLANSDVLQAIESELIYLDDLASS